MMGLARWQSFSTFVVLPVVLYHDQHSSACALHLPVHTTQRGLSPVAQALHQPDTMKKDGDSFEQVEEVRDAADEDADADGDDGHYSETGENVNDTDEVEDDEEVPDEDEDADYDDEEEDADEDADRVEDGADQDDDDDAGVTAELSALSDEGRQHRRRHRGAAKHLYRLYLAVLRYPHQVETSDKPADWGLSAVRLNDNDQDKNRELERLIKTHLTGSKSIEGAVPAQAVDVEPLRGFVEKRLYEQSGRDVCLVAAPEQGMKTSSEGFSLGILADLRSFLKASSVLQSVNDVVANKKKPEAILGTSTPKGGEDDDEEEDTEEDLNLPELKKSLADDLRGKASVTLRALQTIETVQEQAKEMKGLGAAFAGGAGPPQKKAEADRRSPEALCYHLPGEKQDPAFKVELCRGGGNMIAFDQFPIILVEEIPVRKQGDGSGGRTGGSPAFDQGAKRPLQLLWYHDQIETTNGHVPTSAAAADYGFFDFERVFLNRLNAAHFFEKPVADMDAVFGKRKGKWERVASSASDTLTELTTQMGIANADAYSSQARSGLLGFAMQQAYPVIFQLMGVEPPSGGAGHLATLTSQGVGGMGGIAGLRTEIANIQTMWALASGPTGLLLLGVYMRPVLFKLANTVGINEAFLQRKRHEACNVLMGFWRGAPVEEINAVSFGKMMAEFVNMLERVTRDVQSAEKGVLNADYTEIGAAIREADRAEREEDASTAAAEVADEQDDDDEFSDAEEEHVPATSSDEQMNEKSGAQNQKVGDGEASIGATSEAENPFGLLLHSYFDSMADSTAHQLRRAEMAPRRANATTLEMMDATSAQLQSGFQWAYPDGFFTKTLEPKLHSLDELKSPPSELWCLDLLRAYVGAPASGAKNAAALWSERRLAIGQHVHRLEMYSLQHEAVQALQKKKERADKIFAEASARLKQLQQELADLQKEELGGLLAGGPSLNDTNWEKQKKAVEELEIAIQGLEAKKQTALSSLLVDMTKTAMQSALEKPMLELRVEDAVSASATSAEAAATTYPRVFRDLMHWRNMFLVVEREIPGRFVGNVEERKKSWVSFLRGKKNDDESEDPGRVNYGAGFDIKIKTKTSKLVEDAVVEALLAAKDDPGLGTDIDLRKVVLHGLHKQIREKKGLLEELLPETWFRLVQVPIQERDAFLRWLLSDVLITNKNTNEEGEPLADGEREALSLTEETAKDFYHWGYREDVGALRQLGTGASALARQELNAIGQEMEKKKASGTRKRDRFYRFSRRKFGFRSSDLKFARTAYARKKMSLQEQQPTSGAAGRTLFDGALDYASAGIEAARRATVTAWDTTKNLAIGRAGSSSDNDLREKLSKARDYAEQEHLRTRIVPKFLKWLYVDVIQTRWRKKYLHVHQKKIADNVKGCEPVLLKIFQDVSPEEETGIFLKRAMGRDEKKMETPY